MKFTLITEALPTKSGHYLIWVRNFQLPLIEYYSVEKNKWSIIYTVIAWFDFNTITTEGIVFDREGYALEYNKD